MLEALTEKLRAWKETIFPKVSTDDLIASYLVHGDWEYMLALRQRHDVLSKLLKRYYQDGYTAVQNSQAPTVLQMISCVFSVRDNDKLLSLAQQIGSRQDVQKIIFEILISREHTDLIDMSRFVCTMRLEGLPVLRDAFQWCDDHIMTSHTSVLFHYAMEGCSPRFWPSVVSELLARRDWEASILRKLKKRAAFFCFIGMVVRLESHIKQKQAV